MESAIGCFRSSDSKLMHHTSPHQSKKCKTRKTSIKTRKKHTATTQQRENKSECGWKWQTSRVATHLTHPLVCPTNILQSTDRAPGKNHLGNRCTELLLLKRRRNVEQKTQNNESVESAGIKNGRAFNQKQTEGSRAQNKTETRQTDVTKVLQDRVVYAHRSRSGEPRDEVSKQLQWHEVLALAPNHQSGHKAQVTRVVCVPRAAS